MFGVFLKMQLYIKSWKKLKKKSRHFFWPGRVKKPVTHFNACAIKDPAL